MGRSFWAGRASKAQPAQTRLNGVPPIIEKFFCPVRLCGTVRLFGIPKYIFYHHCAKVALLYTVHYKFRSRMKS